MRARFPVRPFLLHCRAWTIGIGLLFLAGQTAPAASRVAIFTADRNLEALLTSSLKDCEILARSDLPQAAAEAALSGAPLAIEGADLALILEKAGRETSVRLVSAPTGATVANWMSPPLPADELARWIALRAEPFLSASAKSDAPRVSLLGLRFDTDSPENRAAERLANLKLAAEFQGSGAVVLERWRLGDLVFEKSLRAEESEFWQQAEVLDGSLRREGGQCVAEIRVRRPSAPERRLTARAQTPSLLAKRIASLTLDRPTPTESKNTLEPKAFLAEARWMLANGLPREAWQAAEAALALGATGTGPEMLRIKAAAMAAYPDDLAATYGGDGGYRVDAFPKTELPERVDAATNAIALAGDYLKNHPPVTYQGWWTLEDPFTLGVHSLYTGLRVLRTACDSGWARENATTAQTLREALQRNIRILEDAPHHRDKYTFFTYLSHYAGYWNNTPEEAIAFYRKVLRTDFNGAHPKWPQVIREELFHGDKPHPPFLAGEVLKTDLPFGLGGQRLLDAPGESADRIWAVFLDELAASPDTLSQADALAFRWQAAADASSRLAVTGQIIDFLDVHQSDLAGPHGRAIFQCFRDPLRSVNHTKDAAATQERLVAFFKRVIDGPDPLPGGILRDIDVAFSGRRLNAKSAQAGKLLAAIDARAARPGRAPFEDEELTTAQLELYSEFPDLRPVRNSEGAAVSNLWLAPENTPADLVNRTSLHAEEMIWHRGALWALADDHGRLWHIQPETGKTQILSPLNRPHTSWGSQLVAWGDRLAVSGTDGVKVLDPNLAIWRDVKLPNETFQLGISGTTLWAASGYMPRTGITQSGAGAALYRISPDLSATLHASSRRRPIEHPLDETIVGEPFAVLPAPREGVVLATLGNNWNFLDSATGHPPDRLDNKFIGNIRTSSHPGIIVRCHLRGGDRNRLGRVELFTSQGYELLLSHPTLGAKGPSRFPFPQNLDDYPAKEFTVAWDGKTLTVLAWRSEGAHGGLTDALLFRIDDNRSFVAPLHIAWSEPLRKRVSENRHNPDSFHYPSPAPRCLIPTDTGLVLTSRGSSGFWFIPYADLAPKLTKIAR